jgi:hypothetical protein
LMRTFIALLITSIVAIGTAAAQKTTPSEPKGIQDNSFLVEEAYNQEDGVIQHISSFQRSIETGNWVFSETDEWPLRTIKHQLSLTLQSTRVGDYTGSKAGFGDTAVNYRYQLVGSGETRLAISPRLSMLLPTGNSKAGRGTGGYGMQTNLPVSVVVSKSFVTHWNAGATWVPRQKNAFDERARTVGVNLGQSMIWLAKPNFNVMLETVWNSSESVVAAGKTDRASSIYLNPGVRGAFNFKSGLQIVPGVAVPVGVGPSAGDKGVIMYLSFEHPFAFAHSKK